MIKTISLTAMILFASTLIPAQTPSIGGCSILPANNVWNTPIDTLPVSPHSAAYVHSIGANSPLHPDFGSDPGNGIPFNVVDGSAAWVKVNFGYASESDPGPYPIPSHPLIEGGSDHHVLVLDKSNCTDYEMYNASRNSDGTWHASAGAVFNLQSNQLRPNGWTSADAAGLPILPGLVKYDEVASGSINHAIRFTATAIDHDIVWPARHNSSWLFGSQYPPMGTRFRLKASFDVSSFPPAAQVILDAMKKYGIILADIGAPWFISGAPDSRWNDDVLHSLTALTGADFEAVDESSLMVDADSGQAQSGGAPSGLARGTWVQLVSQNSGLCLESPGRDKSTTLIQMPCAGTPDQLFMFTAVNGGYKVTIQATGMQMDVHGGPSELADGAPVVDYPFWGGKNEIWNLTSSGSSGYYQVQPLSSGKCLDVAAASQSAGAALQQWTCWGGPNQAWKIVQP